MGNEMTKTQNQKSSEKRRPEINASCDLWNRFDEWKALHGYQTDSEGLRAAIIKVTNFEPKCQQKIA